VPVSSFARPWQGSVKGHDDYPIGSHPSWAHWNHELEGDYSPAVPGAEVLAENRFLAARDGMDARLIDPATRRLTPVREILGALLAECRPHARVLGCAGALDRVQRLAAANGADRQRAFAAGSGRLDHSVASLADGFLASEWPAAPAGQKREHI
jgi:gamma-glutamyl:cysteine ligase YbdK (ATP-grasp superfamily)